MCPKPGAPGHVLTVGLMRAPWSNDIPLVSIIVYRSNVRLDTIHKHGYTHFCCITTFDCESVIDQQKLNQQITKLMNLWSHPKFTQVVSVNIAAYLKTSGDLRVTRLSISWSISMVAAPISLTRISPVAHSTSGYRFGFQDCSNLLFHLVDWDPV
ncbi:hypothetical protein DPMN_129433 [Dreissena polymorpha]|uniref:Uncharacterized protein n=1 Tax=Dreissena polymorpha TaxID=45954 RepID=A0A9D4H2M7_DREPO|nr:hypothetical protein DPMN_129433 [Dreissena polymorpha]